MTTHQSRIEQERANLVRAITHGHVDAADWSDYDALVAGRAYADGFNEAARLVGRDAQNAANDLIHRLRDGRRENPYARVAR